MALRQAWLFLCLRRNDSLGNSGSLSWQREFPSESFQVNFTKFPIGCGSSTFDIGFLLMICTGLAWEKSFAWAVKQDRLRAVSVASWWTEYQNISVFFFHRVLQVIQDDALTFGSQQTRGFVVTFRSFLKGDDDKYVVNFRCKWSFHRSKRYNYHALRTLRASLRILRLQHRLVLVVGRATGLIYLTAWPC